MSDNKTPSSPVSFLEGTCVDGFWPYLPGRDPSLEPSIWSAIACRNRPVAKAFLDRMIKIQQPDGGWASYEGATKSDWTTAVALLGLRLLGQAEDGAQYRKQFDRGVDLVLDSRADYYKGLVKALYILWKGPTYRYSRGWPWTIGSFDWVEPTAYVIIALRGTPHEKQLPKLSSALSDAEEFLLKSWSYPMGWGCADRSGPEANEKKAESESGMHQSTAYPSNTALALLALQRYGTGQPMRGGMDFLSGTALKQESTLGYAWSAIALDAYGAATDAQVEGLKKRQRANGSFSDNTITNALSTIAVNIKSEGNPLKAAK